MIPRRASLLAACALTLAACAAPPPPPAPPPVAIAAPAPPPVVTPPPEPPISRAEAEARGRAIAAGWAKVHWQESAQAPWLREQGLDEDTVRRLLEALSRPCLDERDREQQACKEIADSETEIGKTAEALAEVLGLLADPSAPGKRSMRLLVRLDARGLWRAGLEVKEILERRARSHLGACAAPSEGEIAAARASLADLAIVDPGPAARWPSAAELNELAYFYAAVAGSGPSIGAAAEDTSAKPLPAGHPDLAARKALRAEAGGALLDGDLERHLRAAEAYLQSLGYPGPMRIAEEGDARWGGSGASFLIREAARSAEILGRYDVAEALYRRALPGGGACGTSAPSYRDGQIEGVIRVTEQARGCRAAAAERLFAVAFDSAHLYGPDRLTQAGFDVPRLYAGALSTLGRDDAAALQAALQKLPDRAPDALARLQRMGAEAWAARVRAVPGFADTARGAGVDRLLALAEHGPAPARAEALLALSRVVEDRGWDPCVPGSGRMGWGYGSSDRPRNVRSVMGACETRVDGKRIAALVARVSRLAADPDPAVREAVAVTLGRTGSPAARPALQKLARDRFDRGGQVCTTRPDGSNNCTANLPVQRAAQNALDAVAAADRTRARQKAERAAAKRN